MNDEPPAVPAVTRRRKTASKTPRSEVGSPAPATVPRRRPKYQPAEPADLSKKQAGAYVALYVFLPIAVITAILGVNDYMKHRSNQIEAARIAALPPPPPVSQTIVAPTASERRHSDPNYVPSKREQDAYIDARFSGERNVEMKKALCSFYLNC